jgi:type IV secretory pathway VirB10-like protein
VTNTTRAGNTQAMSTPDDPKRRMPPDEDPTRRMPPAEQRGEGAPPPAGGERDPRAPVAREREVIEDDPVWRAKVSDQLRSMRNALFGVGLLALLGLALGVYLLATRDDEGNGDAASRSQVRDLEQRVDRVESQVDRRATAGDVAEIQEAQSALADRLNTVEEQAGQDDTQQLEQSIEQLSDQIEQLSERVDEVEQEQQQQQNEP